MDKQRVFGTTASGYRRSRLAKRKGEALAIGWRGATHRCARANVTAYVGTSGWQYPHWRGNFYPAELSMRTWLEHYADRFATVEVNNAFYRLPERSTFSSWCKATPPGFIFAVKASRYLTHIKRLREPNEPVRRLVERLSGLGDKLGPVLLQLPPTLKFDLRALDETLSCFPPAIRVAVEFRHPSWYLEDVAGVLARHRAAYCLADRPLLKAPRWRTADWGYVRFHEGRASPQPCYGEKALRTWAGSLAELFGTGLDVYVYFNNDSEGCAPKNATRFSRLLEQAGFALPETKLQLS